MKTPQSGIGLIMGGLIPQEWRHCLPQVTFCPPTIHLRQKVGIRVPFATMDVEDRAKWHSIVSAYPLMGKRRELMYVPMYVWYSSRV